MSITLPLMLAPALALLLSAPAVFSVEPQAIATSGGRATVLGFELTAEMTVRANGAPATQVEAETANQLTVTLPPGQAGRATLTLEVDGRVVATLPAAFSYMETPALAGVRAAAAASQARREAEQGAAARRERAFLRAGAGGLHEAAIGAAREILRGDARGRREAWRRAAAERDDAEAARQKALADLAAQQPDCLKAGYDDWQAVTLAPDGRYFVSWSVQVVNGCDRPRRVRVMLALYDRDRREIRRYVETLTVPARQTVAAKGTALEGGLILRAVARRAAELTPLD